MASQRTIDFPRIADGARGIAQQLLLELLPDGEERGHDWWARNPRRNDKEIGSFSVRIETGGFNDLAEPEHFGRDYIGLVAFCRGHDDMAKAALELAEKLGVDPYLETVAHVPRGTHISGKRAKILPRERKGITDGPLVQVFPVPTDIGNPVLMHRGQSASAKYVYRDLSGQTLGVISRHYVWNQKKGQNDKEIVTWTAFRNVLNGTIFWKEKAFPEPLPIYKGEHLASRPTDTVLIVEGEKCVDFARVHIPGLVAVSWPGGSSRILRAEWWALRGRSVILWPDHDVDGLAAMDRLSAALIDYGATRVQTVDLESLRQALGIPILPAKFDIADIPTDEISAAAWAEKHPTAPITPREAGWLASFLDSPNAFIGRSPAAPESSSAGLPIGSPSIDAIESLPILPITPAFSASNALADRPKITLGNGPILSPEDPRGAALSFIADRFMTDEHQTIRIYRGEWFVWLDGCWRMRQDVHVRSLVSDYLSRAREETDPGRYIRYLPNIPRVNNVVDQLKGLSLCHPDTVMPGWIDKNGRQIERFGDHISGPTSSQIISFDNGLFNRSEYLKKCEGQQLSFNPEISMIPHTPQWFSPNVLPYSYDPTAECPLFEKFLNQCATDETGKKDESWIRCMAMWFGLNLTLDTSYQKIAMFNGAPGSGKGTLARTLGAIVGEFNTCALRLSRLDGQFALWPLVGKQSAICFDVRLGRSADSVSIVEQLLSISGEDPQQIEKKGENPYTAKLSARFTLVGNDLLNLPDNSNALDRRMLVFPFRVSHKGFEDITLQSKLMAELPGIAQWALIGLRILDSSGKLTGPDSGEDDKQELARIASPIKAWADDQCEFHGTHTALVSDLFQAWQKWTLDNGNVAGSSASFGVKLRSAFPGLRSDRIGEGNRKRFYRGIRLNPQFRPLVNYET